MTVCFFILLVLASLAIATRNLIPLFTPTTMETEFTRSFLSNSVGYCGNKTIEEEMGWFERTFSDYMLPRSSNFMYTGFVFSEFIKSLKGMGIENIYGDALVPENWLIIAPL